MNNPKPKLRRTGGRNNKWQPPPLDKVETYAQRGLSYSQIAAALGISKRTLERHRKDDAAFREAVERGRSQGIVALANVGYDLAIVGKDGPMIRYLLSTVGGYKESARIELTGADGQDLIPPDTRTKKQVSELLGKYAELAQRALDIAANAGGVPGESTGEETRTAPGDGAGESVDS